MARKKQHLRYQAKKGRLQAAPQSESEVSTKDNSRTASQTKSPVVQSSPQKFKKQEFTKLPESETRFVRKEIVYIGFIALVLVLFYVLIFLAFRFTGVDEWLSELIKLNN